MGGCFHRIHVGPQEQEFPAVLLFLTLDHRLDLRVCVAAAGILQTVSRDDEERLFGAVLLARVLVDIPDVMDCTADSI